MSSSLNAPQIDAGVETSASDEDESGLDTPLPPPPSPESYSDADEMGAPPPPPPPPSFGFSGAKMAKGKGDLKKALEKSNVDSETVSKSGKMFEELGKIFLKKGITKKAEIQISSTASSDQGLSKTEYNSPEHQALLKEKMKAISGASTESLSFDAKIQGKWTKVSQKDVDSGKISQDDFNLLKTKAEERSQKDSQKFSGKGTSIQKTMTKEPLSQKALDIQKKISETKKNAPQGSFLDQIKLGSSLKKAASSENIISDSETSSGNPLVEALKSAFKTGLKKNELTKGGAATEKNTQIDFKANLKKTSIKLSDFEAKQEEINKQAAVSMKNNPDAKSKILKKTPPPPLPRDIVEITPSIEDSESPPPLPPRDNLETTTDINDVMPNELNVHSSATTITNEPIQVESSTLKMATDLEPQIEIQSEITIPTLETQSTLAGFIDEPIQVESSTLKMATDLEPQIEMQPEITIPTLETQCTLAGPIDEPIQLNNQITEENIVPPPPPPLGHN
ncbi:hypothetical protein Bealeia2_00827 [Candidatus Bealeia paramacronuclearis]|uniref:hypothetical protein n=1 Tax=Candidatus Bealeia paramacronuclearis TaxID=1921001 RepID=UPI002BECCCCE|nr:hypothetical protein [Candidatus Bealeia paramacronuclearis]